jgi:CDP-diacylglycerol--glycerol-3-phosphate 3-phosphatidyltransferase
MPTIYELKTAFQNLLRPLVLTMAVRNITANHVTLAAVVLSFVGGGAIALWPDAPWPLFVLPVVLFVRMALNAVDGMLAREHNMRTKLGAILNELGDVVSDAALYLPFALIPVLQPALVVIIVVLAVISEMTGVVAVQIGGERRYDGPMGKSDRAFAFSLLAIAIAIGFQNGLWLNILLVLIAVLLVLTIRNRVRNALKEQA